VTPIGLASEDSTLVEIGEKESGAERGEVFECVLKGAHACFCLETHLRRAIQQ